MNHTTAVNEQAEASPSGTAEIPKLDLQSPDKGLDHAWRYFALHAQQRMSVFNFFVVLSGVMATGIGAGLQAGKSMAPAVAMLGALLSVFSLVFHRLDQRGSELVKFGESALVAGEAACMPVFARVLLNESERRNAPADVEGVAPDTWTFGRSFRTIFAVMGGIGTIACGFSLWRWAS